MVSSYKSSDRNKFVNSIRQTQRGYETERRRREEAGRKFNGKFSGFSYFKFTGYLKYEAALAGIKVIKIFENWTSQA